MHSKFSIYPFYFIIDEASLNKCGKPGRFGAELVICPCERCYLLVLTLREK